MSWCVSVTGSAFGREMLGKFAALERSLAMHGLLKSQFLLVFRRSLIWSGCSPLHFLWSNVYKTLLFLALQQYCFQHKLHLIFSILCQCSCCEKRPCQNSVNVSSDCTLNNHLFWLLPSFPLLMQALVFGSFLCVCCMPSVELDVKQICLH